MDALATLDGDRIQILVWHYHDDLVDAPEVQVTLRVAMPVNFGSNALVTHSRVDATHGNAYTVWESQDRPPVPTAAQIAALRGAMDSVSFEPSRHVDVTDDTVTLSFGLPRFGISLLTLEAPEPDREVPEPRNAAPQVGCGCATSEHGGKQDVVSLAVALAALAIRRKRLSDSAPNRPNRRR